MNVETAFGDLGVGAVTGVQLMGWLGMSIDELKVPERFHRLEAVIEYLQQFPEDTQRFLISKATRGKVVDKLDHMFEYVHLLQIKEAQEKEIESLQTEKSAVELGGDSILLSDIENRLSTVNTDYQRIREEISLYEK